MKVAVLGTGLIGGSIGLAARARAAAQVSGWDPDPDVRDRALGLGAIDATCEDIAGAVAGADVVFVAAPVGALVATAREALRAAGAEAVVTDVGSTKRFIADAISDPRFVPGHPLAGSEASGVQHAHEDMFDGAVWYLARVSPHPPGLEALIRALGALPVTIDPELHDRLMANVSHLPHVLANVLVTQAHEQLVAASPSHIDAGPSFRDATRVAGSNSAIWTDIYLSNGDFLIEAIGQLRDRLAEVCAELQTGDAQALRAWNERARRERKALLRQGS